MLKPIKVTLLGIMATTTATIAIPQANAYSSLVGQQSEAIEQNDSSLVASHRRFRRGRRVRRVHRVRWRRKWVCYRRPHVFYRHGRKIVKLKRHCFWKKYRYTGHHF